MSDRVEEWNLTENDKEYSKHACAVWELRWSVNYGGETLTVATIRNLLKEIAKQYVFQFELGDSGYEHVQCRISLIKKRRYSEKHLLLKLFGKYPPNYCQPTTTINHSEPFSYVMKADTRLHGPYTDQDDDAQEIYIPAHYRDIDITKLYPFQQTIWNNVKSPINGRQINLVYCKGGNKGKSTIAHLCRLFQRCLVIPGIVNDAKELIQVVCNLCMDRKLRNPGAVFIDMPRAINKERLYGMYSAIEVIKDGYLYDMRNHMKQWDIDSPHVWVFTNHLPDLTLLSQDRWNIFTIDSNLCLDNITEEILRNPEYDPEDKKYF